MGVNVLLAGVFESGWDEMEIADVPSTFRDGPDYLNILRFVEMPQALAMAAERGRVRLVGAAVEDWRFAVGVGEVLGWERGRIEIGTR